MKLHNFTDIIERFIENILEKYNAYIQAIVIIVGFYTGYQNLFVERKDSVVIVELLIIILVEMLMLHIKDSTTQRKLNVMGLDILNGHGGVRRGLDIPITDFFKDARYNFFVSGIAISKFITNYEDDLKQLIQRKIKVFLLIAAPEEINECTRMYYGCLEGSEDHNHRNKEIIQKSLVALRCIRNDEILFDAFEKGDLQIRLFKMALSSTFVSYDCLENKTNGKIKVSFYQFQIHNSQELPSVLIEAKADAAHWHKYYLDIINKEWVLGEKVEGHDAIDCLIDNLEILGSKNKSN